MMASRLKCPHNFMSYGIPSREWVARLLDEYKGGGWEPSIVLTGGQSQDQI
jgi:hypothetical protein